MNPDPSSESPLDILPVLQTKGETRVFYDKISKVYDLLAEHTEGPIRDAGLRKLAAHAGETVLEIGYGTGHGLVALAKAVGPSGHVYGIDLSEGMRQQAEARLCREHLAERVTLCRGDAADLPYNAETMDAVFMSFTLELFDTPQIPVVLRECLCVLRPSARIVVVGMSKEGQNRLVSAFEWTHQHFPSFLDCRPIFVRRALEAAGFSIDDSEMLHMWVPVEIVRGIRPSTKQPTSRSAMLGTIKLKGFVWA